MRRTGSPSGGRRDPDAWLRELDAAERAGRRGRLKVFLGYAPGVGKSFRLLDEARRRRARGEDVVIGALQADLPPGACRAIAGIERIAPRGSGDRRAIDVDAILRRAPGVCVIDGLAYANPPGSRRASRREDIEDLLDAGISVIATVGLEYIEEQQAFVRGVVGESPPQSVPQAFVSRADELVVVDAAPDAAQAGTLNALRQRALLIAAEAVDRQLDAYLRAHGLESRWAAQERILVCMTPRAVAARMLDTARRAVDHFHGELYAAYVVQEHLTGEDRAANRRNLALARAQQARVDILHGSDPAATLLAHARRLGITQLFVGHTLQRSWAARLRGTPLDRLIRDAEEMDVRVFPQ